MRDMNKSSVDVDDFLFVKGLFKAFGGLRVINDLSFSLAEGEILGIIGPNGSGKTTLFNLISGFLKPDVGTIHFNGERLSGKRPSAICKAGIARTFQLVKPFPELTALENVMAGRSYGSRPARNLAAARDEAEEILGMVGMNGKQSMPAGRLNLLDRKRLEIARALATKPRLMLLDEVFAGLNPAEVEEALDLIKVMSGLGITIMIVEHLMRVILGVSHRVVVISHGAKIFDGAPRRAVEDRQVIEAYLGED
ncbi:MAG: ABC transporter ATP-binding protein [Pseudomonadota bacterium]